MRTPEDMKQYRAEDYEDAFSLIPPHTAGWILLGLVGIACILEPVLR